LMKRVTSCSMILAKETKLRTLGLLGFMIST